MVRIFVLAVMAGAALWGEGWTVVKGSEGIQWPYDAVQTPDGALWVAAGTQVYRYDGRQVQVYGESQGLGSKRGMVLAVDGSGALLAGTTEGLFRMEGGRFRRLM
jgi:ligand-binding sensor domain-containing protein